MPGCLIIRMNQCGVSHRFFLFIQLQRIIIYPNKQTIGDYAFEDCVSLDFGDYYWTNSLQTIGKHAFQGCTSLRGFAVTSSKSQLASIDDYAFYGCTALKYVRVDGDSFLKRVGDSAFMGCTALEEICLGYHTIESIGANAFADCTSLTRLDIMDLGYSLKEMGEGCFARSGVTSIALPDSVTVIPYNAFKDCTSLKRVDLGDATTQIGMLKLNLPRAAKCVEEEAFAGTAAQAVVLPDGCTDIGPAPLREATA